MARLVGLAHLNRDHFESRLLECEEAVLTRNWPEARRLLAPLLGEHASARVCALMAEIEEGERGDATLAHAWLARAARGAARRRMALPPLRRGAGRWSAVCPVCSNFDTLAWSAAGAEPARAEILLAPDMPPRKLATRPAEPATIISLPARPTIRDPA